MAVYHDIACLTYISLCNLAWSLRINTYGYSRDTIEMKVISALKSRSR